MLTKSDLQTFIDFRDSLTLVHDGVSHNDSPKFLKKCQKGLNRKNRAKARTLIQMAPSLSQLSAP